MLGYFVYVEVRYRRTCTICWATLCMYRFATRVPERFAGLLCVCAGSLQAYLHDMLGYFVYVQVRYMRTYTICWATLCMCRFATGVPEQICWATLCMCRFAT